MEHKNTTLMSVNEHLVKSSAGCSVPLALVLEGGLSCPDIHVV